MATDETEWTTGGRRGFLRAGGAVGVALAGGVGTVGADGAAERHGVEFGRVVDAVEDLGVDPDGGEPVDDALAGVAREGDTLVRFPPGEYLVDDPVVVGADFGVESTTGDREDVVFRPVRGKLTRLFETAGEPSGFYVGQVSLDRREEYRSSIGLVRGGFADAVQIHDVLVEGWAPESGNKLLSFNVYDPDGSALVDGVTDRGPAQFGAYPDGTSIAIFNGRATEGEVTYRNLAIHNASESGIYAGKAKGTIRVEDSYFKNCAHSAVRVTGTDSVVRNTTIVMDVDDLHPDAEVTDPDGVEFNRAIWAQSADVEKGGPLVVGCEIVVENSGGGVGGIVNHPDSGGLEIRDTRVECNDPTSYFDPILIAEESTGDAGTPYEAVIDGVSVTGDAAERPAIRIEERDGTVVRNCCIQMPNTDGILFEGTSNGRIENTSISVGGEATMFEGADVETSGVTSDGGCPRPVPGSWRDGEDGDDPAELPHTLAVSKTSEDFPDGRVRYEFTVSEALAPTEDVELGGNDARSGTTAEGGMGPESGVDTWRFAGRVEAFDLEGAADVLVNGEPVAPDEVVGAPDGTDDSGDSGAADPSDPGTLPNRVVFDGRGSGLTAYRVSASGALRRDDAASETAALFGDFDEVEGSTATGTVVSGIDVYRFSGDVTALTVDGDAEVRLSDVDG